jgi:hypothetical protein
MSCLSRNSVFKRRFAMHNIGNQPIGDGRTDRSSYLMHRAGASLRTSRYASSSPLRVARRLVLVVRYNSDQP